MLLPNQSDAPASHDDKATDVQRFLGELSLIVEQFEKVNDPAIQTALKELRNIKASLEHDKKRSSYDWRAKGKDLLHAAQWIKIICDFLQE